MTVEAEDPRILAIAGAIAEGSAVDWTETSTHAPVDDEELFGELRAVERIVAAHRIVNSTNGETVGPSSRQDARDPAKWSHLIIRERIGTGSFGVVYRAHDDHLDIDVALKLTAPVPGASVLWTSTMLEEARLLARVRHPNVVRVYGADHVDDRVGMWMELVVGRTLEQMLQLHGTSSAREAALVGLDVARAVAAVHRVGLVHGDVKPANVMREEGGRTVLMDFGASHDASVGLGRAQGLRGTPVYLAPEVFAGKRPDHASDVYALGVLLFHLVTAEYPVYASTRKALAEMHARGERRQLRDVRPDLPDEFVRVVDRALAPEPLARYRSPGELEAALARFIDPSAPSAPEPAPRLSLRLAMAAVLAGVVAIGGWLLLTNLRSGQSASPAVTSVADPTVEPSSYEVHAAFYRSSDTGDEQLEPGRRLALGDRLSFRLETSVPTYLYIVNEPDQGQAFLLFPLPGQALRNPLPPRAQVRVPEGVDWQVTSAGGREHFVVFVSPQSVDAFEQAFAKLPSPRVGEPLTSAPLPEGALERLRGVGGLTPTRQVASDVPRFSTLFSTPLTGQRETARGLWIRSLTLDNPAP